MSKDEKKSGLVKVRAMLRHPLSDIKGASKEKVEGMLDEATGIIRVVGQDVGFHVSATKGWVYL